MVSSLEKNGQLTLGKIQTAVNRISPIAAPFYRLWQAAITSCQKRDISITLYGLLEEDMDTSRMMEKTVETLSPFETENIMNFLRHLTVKSAISNPYIVTVFLVVAFYAVVKRSKFVLSILFAAISILLLIRYAMPAEGDGLSVSSTLPFAFGGLAIGAFIIYLYFIKTE
jgi:hypothetical protein